MSSLIVMGASARSLAFSARRAGFQPYAIDLFADRDLAAVCPAVKIARYPEDFVAALAEAPPARWMYTGGLENYPRLIDELARIRPLVGNAGAAVRAVRDPVRLGKVVREVGLSWGEILLEGGSAAGGEKKWLLKALRSSGGLGVSLATAGMMREVPRGCYLQRYVEGEAVSAVFVGAGGGAALLGVSRQWTGRDFGMEREFLYVGNMGPLILDANETERLQVLGTALAKEFRLIGLFNVDLVRNDQGLWPLEVNPRYSASVEVFEGSWEWTSVAMHVEACESNALPNLEMTGAKVFCGKAVVYAERDGFVPASLEAIAREWNGNGDRPGLTDLPRTGDAIEAGQPVVTVIAEAGTMSGVEGELRRRVEIVRRSLSTASK